MQRGLNALARRSVLPQPLSPTCVWRAEGGSKSAKKRVKPWQKFKGPLKGKMEVLFTANNKWKYHWFKKHEDLPEELKRLEMHVPYYNAFVEYNPNDPEEIRSYLGKLRANQLREKNEDVIETKGVKLKQWLPDQRVIDNDDYDDDDDTIGEQMEEEYGPDEMDLEWRETREKKERQLEREQERKLRREQLSGASHKRILEFEKMSKPEKLQKLIEWRNENRAYLQKRDALREKIMAMSDEEVIAKLQSEYGYTDDQIEQLLREQEKEVSQEEIDAFEKHYKLGKYYEKGKLSGIDIYLQEKGHPELVGWKEKLFSDEPPEIPPPKDVTKLRFYKKMQEEEAAKKKAEQKAAAEKPAAAPAPAAPAGKAPAKGKK